MSNYQRPQPSKIQMLYGEVLWDIPLYEEKPIHYTAKNVFISDLGLKYTVGEKLYELSDHITNLIMVYNLYCQDNLSFPVGVHPLRNYDDNLSQNKRQILKVIKNMSTEINNIINDNKLDI